MLVTIIIPIYNGASFVEQCLQSVAAQTYEGKIECLLVDDCGIDESMNICEKFVSAYNGSIMFRILHHDRNRGLSAARNTGLNAAQGEYVYFLDDDDMIMPECIESMVEIAMKYPDSQIAFAGAFVINDSYDFLDYTTKQLPEYSNDRIWLQESMLRRYDFGMTMWGKLISVDFIRNYHLFQKSLVHEDEVWNFQASKYIQSAAFVRKNLYVYRISDNSIMNGHSNNEKVARLYELWNAMIEEIGGFNKPLQIYAIYRHIYDETKNTVPRRKKYLSSWLYIKLAVKSHNMFSFRLLLQSIRSLW